MLELRPYQLKNANDCANIINNYGIVYLQHQVRTGKTLTALKTCELVGAKKVIFLTKKKAISSIQGDYDNFGFDFDITVTNYENLHKINHTCDLLVLDEASCLSAFPKPSNRTKKIRELFGNKRMIFLSGTPASESYSQWYHQFWVSFKSPFREYVNFYKWAKDFTTESFIYTSYGQSRDYSKALTDKIDLRINNVVHKYTQKEAGFENVINKKLHFVDMKPSTYTIISKLKRDLVIEGKTETILADSAVKLMSKQHQLGSGSIIFESGNVGKLDNSKALYIKNNIKGKLAIFYYFKEELNILLDEFGDLATTDLKEFNTTDKHFIGQQYSNAMGVNLSKADKLVYYNFGFSGTQYIQSLDRLTIKDRKETEVNFILANNTLDKKIWEVIEQKKNFTLKIYDRIKDTK